MPAKVEWRTQKMWENAEGIKRQVWVQSHAFPELDSKGKVIRVLGLIVDITAFKEAEDLQQSRIEEALEDKRQREK